MNIYGIPYVGRGFILSFMRTVFINIITTVQRVKYLVVIYFIPRPYYLCYLVTHSKHAVIFVLRFVSVTDPPTPTPPTPTASIVSLFHTRKSSFFYSTSAIVADRRTWYSRVDI